MPRIRYLILPVILFGMLAANAMATLLGYAPQSALDENRKLAPPPKWAGSISLYVREANTFITDNFAFRKPLIAAHNTALYEWFASTFSRKVIIGREGWIFGVDFDDQKAVGARPLTDSYKRALKISLIERRDWLAERGTRLIVMYFPRKAEIYEKYLPSWAVPIKQELSESEQIAGALDGDISEVLVRLKDRMMIRSQETPTYYATDGHANHQGAFVGLEALTEHIQRRYPKLSPRPYPASERKLDYLRPTAFGRLMGIPFQDPSWVSVPVGGFSHRARDPHELQDVIPQGARTHHYLNDRAPKVSVVLIGDSFINRLQAYVAEVFGTTESLNMNRVPPIPELKFPVALLDRVRPDFLIMSWVESRLNGCMSACQDAFPIENPPEVRQARLRRLFASSGDGPRAASFNGESVRLGKLTNLSSAPMTVKADTHSKVLDQEVSTVSILPNETAYLFLGVDDPTQPAEPIVVNGRDDQLSVESVSVPVSELRH